MKKDLKKKFNVIHIVEDASLDTGGGIATVVKILTTDMCNDSLKHEVICNNSSELPLSNGAGKITVFNKSDLFGWGYSMELKDHLEMKSKEPNTIFHVHGIWKAIHYLAFKSSKRNGTPCLVSLHGILEPNLSNAQGVLKRLKKGLYWKILSRTFGDLQNIHAITSIEAGNLKSIFSKSNISIIPNSMEICLNLDISSIKEDEKYFLFIGRLVGPKGIDVLVESFISSNLAPNFKLKIVGPIEDASLWRKIEKIIDQHDSIEYLGFRSGKEKDDLIAAAWSVVLPSRMETIGMVNLEAAGLGCPSITTYETGLDDWEEGGGILIESNSIEACKNALLMAGSWSVSERKTRGQRSHHLARQRYSIPVTNLSWENLYSKLLGQ